MATTITLGRPGSARRFFRNLRLRSLGDAWSDEAAATTAAAAAAAPRDPGGDALAAFATSAAGWGVLAFAVWTAGIRLAETWRKA